MKELKILKSSLSFSLNFLLVILPASCRMSNCSDFEEAERERRERREREWRKHITTQKLLGLNHQKKIKTHMVPLLQR